MKKKNVIIISILIVILLIIAGIFYFVFNKQDKDTTLTIIENQWIENNKNSLIDLSIINQVPVLSYNGKGIIFEFLDSLEKNTGLAFNRVPISSNEETKTDYAIIKTNQLEKNDLLFYEDNYAIFTKENVKYSKLSDIQDLVIGLLDDDAQKITTYLRGSSITLKTFKSSSELISALNKEKGSDGAVDAIALPKISYLEDVIDNNFTIAYNITEYPIYYVFRLGSTDKLNTILNKYYKKWYKESYEEAYNNYFASAYFEFKNIDDKTKANFKSKRYIYGFVDNAPFDTIINSKLKGYNSSLLKITSGIADIEIAFEEYPSIESMITAFNENKIDIMFNNYKSTKYNIDVIETASLYSEQLVVLSYGNKNNIVNSIASLKDKTVLTLKNSKISFYLGSNGVNIEECNTLEELLQKVDKNSIIAIDYENYKYYQDSNLNDFKIDYRETLNDDYTFVIRDIKENEIFANLLNFYLSFVNEKTIFNNSFYELSNLSQNELNMGRIMLLIGVFIVFVVALFGYISFKKKSEKNKKISKESKLRYIDALTSLKNRAYLNDNIETWDSSEVYPQAIIIVDLNNIAYINDNYGHQEGDNVIKEAANILIRGQIQNSDIVRTNGNEFLIYLVGYDEKQVVAYNRKLTKELKELSHGFGAASGYSMINDAIKTIDDAVNEATLDMRNNKEELNNN